MLYLADEEQVNKPRPGPTSNFPFIQAYRSFAQHVRQPCSTVYTNTWMRWLISDHLSRIWRNRSFLRNLLNAYLRSFLSILIRHFFFTLPPFLYYLLVPRFLPSALCHIIRKISCTLWHLMWIGYRFLEILVYAKHRSSFYSRLISCMSPFFFLCKHFCRKRFNTLVSNYTWFWVFNIH